MAEKVFFTIPKLPQFVAFLRSDDLFKGPWKKALDDVGTVTEQLAINRAPLFSGQTIAKMTHKVQNKPIPLYVVVKTTARNPRNRYLYPRRVEYSPRSRRRGWFRGAWNTAQTAWDGIFKRATDEMGQMWERGF